jgi:chromosome segregation ATPase
MDAAGLQEQVAAYQKRQAEKDAKICDLEQRLRRLEQTVFGLSNEVRRLRPTRVPGNPDWERF